MYLEKRKLEDSIKYYLVHSYREKGQVKKIRKYLGQNLGEIELNLALGKAKQSISLILDQQNTEIFRFRLSKVQIKRLNHYNHLLKIVHLNTKEWQRFTEEFVYNTNAIEGSTVYREEVWSILQKSNPTEAEEKETKGVAEAVEYIRTTNDELSVRLLQKLHRLCFEGSKIFAGQIRTVEVVIRASNGEIVHQGVPASQLHLALAELISWYKKNKKRFKPLVLAAIIHNQFEHIHPFQDGNGRVGRLLLNYILIKNKYPPINISLEDRGEYYWTLQEYSKNNNLVPSLKFLVKQYHKTLKQVTTKRRIK